MARKKIEQKVALDYIVQTQTKTYQNKMMKVELFGNCLETQGNKHVQEF